MFENEIQVLALNETRLDSSIADSEMYIPHYSLLRKDRDRNGGGVAIYVHESIHINLVSHDSLERLEALCIKVCLKNTKPIIFLNWYRPPNSKVEVFNHYEDFFVFALMVSMGNSLLWVTLTVKVLCPICRPKKNEKFKFQLHLKDNTNLELP